MKYGNKLCPESNTTLRLKQRGLVLWAGEKFHLRAPFPDWNLLLKQLCPPPKDEKVRVGFLCNLYTLSRPLILAPESKTWCRSLQISRQSLLCGLGHPLALILDTSQWQTKLSVGRELGNAISSEPAGCLVSLYHYFLRSQKFQTGAWASR